MRDRLAIMKWFAPLGVGSDPDIVLPIRRAVGFSRSRGGVGPASSLRLRNKPVCAVSDHRDQGDLRPEDALERICGRVHLVEVRPPDLRGPGLTDLAEGATTRSSVRSWPLLSALNCTDETSTTRRATSHPLLPPLRPPPFGERHRPDHAVRRRSSRAADHLRLLRRPDGTDVAVVLLAGNKTALGNSWYRRTSPGASSTRQLHPPALRPPARS